MHGSGRFFWGTEGFAFAARKVGGFLFYLISHLLRDDRRFPSRTEGNELCCI